MKRLVLLCGALLLAGSLYAYDREETLIDGRIEHGGFVAPVIRYTQIDNSKWGLVFGGRGGWVVNHAFSVGGAGYSLVKNNVLSDVTDTAGDRLGYSLSYGGLEMEYIIESDDLVHGSLVALLGSGTVGGPESITRSVETSTFFVFEPGVNVVLNVTKYFRVSMGAHYRLVSGVNHKRLSNEKVNGPSAALSFLFGKF